MKPTIEVIITPAGEVLIEAIGFKGGACEKATAAIEQALGAVRVKRHKPEFQQQATVSTGNRQKLGQ